MPSTWKYLTNQFLSSTENSYNKAVKLSMYHDAALNIAKVTHPELVAIYNRYHTLHLALIAAFNSWKALGGSQEGQTLNVTQQLILAYAKLNGWDATVQGTYAKGTPEYMAIFPDGRYPFNSGSIDDRILAYKVLAESLNNYAALAAVETLVNTTYTTLDNARNAQSGSISTVGAESGTVEAARIAAMTMQYRNVGFCMDTFYNLPDLIASLFDLQLLREHDQTEFTGTLDPMENEAVLVHTFLSFDQMRVKSNGNAAYNLYLASFPGGTNSTPIAVLAHDDKTITVSDFNAADLATHRYLTAVSQTAGEVTQYIIDLI